jgi:hypothetical protein
MLTPQQVIPFLDHDDPEVRQHAVLYLAGANDPSPASADDLWRAIDKLGGPQQAFSHVDRLEMLPQTDESIARTLAALPAAGVDARHALVRVLRSLDLELVRRHRDAIRSAEAVPAEVNEHLDHSDGLWDRLIEKAKELEGKQLTEADALAAERIIEALARRPEVADRAVELLRDPAVHDWREVVVADLVGEMRLDRPEAVEALIDKLRDQEADILWETAGEGLVRVGNDAVVERLAERFASEDWGFRISAAGVLGRIKRPSAEAAILRLMPGEADKEVTTFLVASLLDLCPTDPQALEEARRVILDGKYDPGTADLKMMLVSVGTMVDYEPAEAAEWRRLHEEDRKRWESGAADADGIMAAIQSHQIGAQDLGSVGQILGIPDSRPLPPLRPPVRQRRAVPGRRGAEGYAPAQHARPFRRPNAKVGRNDPCPCGSGKKFKKCCMRD